MLNIQENNAAFEIAGFVTEKLFRRIEAQMKIKHIYAHQNVPFAINHYINQLNCAISEGGLAGDKGEYITEPSEVLQH